MPLHKVKPLQLVLSPPLAAKGDLESRISALPTSEANRLRERLYGNPRPEDVDPDNLLTSNRDRWCSASDQCMA